MRWSVAVSTTEGYDVQRGSRLCSGLAEQNKMCGICGFLRPDGFELHDAERQMQRMADRLRHRGPDDGGSWVDSGAGVAIGHRRLAIIDLTQAGHQPMMSASGRYVLAFNGEIYNHKELRKQIGKRDWRGHSDSETLISLIEEWGIERALCASVGMFAFAVWDRTERALFLARDRLGEKPLFYGWQGPVFLFGSELKSLQAHRAFRGEIETGALPLYLRRGYVPAPWSIWQGIGKLLPGTFLKLQGLRSGQLPEPTPYWSLGNAVAEGRRDPFIGSMAHAVDTLEARLKAAIAGQMISDVPLGAFLSGGIDSSTVVALMQAQSAKPVRTFSIGFDHKEYDETRYAKVIAAHLGTNHTELFVSSAQAQDVIPQLPIIFDEPFGDSSAIPTFLVSQLARQQVAVSLSGDGGDELFGGYGRYFNQKAERLWRGTRAVPTAMRDIAVAALESQLPRWADSLALRLAEASHYPLGSPLKARADLVASVAKCRTFTDYYLVMTSHWNLTPCAVEDAPPDHHSRTVAELVAESIGKMMVIDTLSYLPDDILTKVDRTSMAVSLETRVPLLDHRVVEFAWSLPHRLKVDQGQGKLILREVLKRHLPQRLFERPKRGFGVPVDQWIRGPLRDWAEDLLDETSLKDAGVLDPKPIRTRWREHLQRRRNWRDSLWTILMYQAWRKTASLAPTDQ